MEEGDAVAVGVALARADARADALVLGDLVPDADTVEEALPRAVAERAPVVVPPKPSTVGVATTEALRDGPAEREEEAHELVEGDGRGERVPDTVPVTQRETRVDADSDVDEEGDFDADVEPVVVLEGAREAEGAGEREPERLPRGPSEGRGEAVPEGEARGEREPEIERGGEREGRADAVPL